MTTLGGRWERQRMCRPFLFPTTVPHPIPGQGPANSLLHISQKWEDWTCSLMKAMSYEGAGLALHSTLPLGSSPLLSAGETEALE